MSYYGDELIDLLSEELAARREEYDEGQTSSRCRSDLGVDCPY